MTINRGVANLTLDRGSCPKWLFKRMVKLNRELLKVVVEEEGPDEFIKRIGNPVWFQSLGALSAFDFNASGMTTVLTAALKQAVREQEKDLGVFVCGGKGKTSRKTPEEIEGWGGDLLDESEAANLVYNSRMSAKVDSSLIQDGFHIYHHSFFFSENGAWTVVQQGMSKKKQRARRYHWHSEKVTDLITEPHSGIISQLKEQSSLNLTSKGSEDNRKVSRELLEDGNYRSLMRDLRLLNKYSSSVNQSATLQSGEKGQLTLLNMEDREFYSHPLVNENFSKSNYLKKIMWKLCNDAPEDFEDLLSKEGVGPKTIRALSLVSELIYGAEASYEDPARYSFAHGGKDGTPYQVDTDTYDKTIQELRKYVGKADVEPKEKDRMMKQLV
ncbi:MAG: DUF763 domain-containing protein [Candidatus Magasanikbacteria bacterium]